MSKHKRLFFALMPDEKICQQLADLHRHLPHRDGNRVHPQDLHVTLQFLGAVSSDQQVCVTKVADRIASAAFHLEITHLDYWSRSRVLVAEPESFPQELTELVKMLGDKLQRCGLAPEKRAYRPHITLARKTRAIPKMPLPEAISWHVDHLFLLESRPDISPPWYRVIDSWMLE